jgi:hypothetical protein
MGHEPWLMGHEAMGHGPGGTGNRARGRLSGAIGKTGRVQGATFGEWRGTGKSRTGEQESCDNGNDNGNINRGVRLDVFRGRAQGTAGVSGPI